MMILRPVLWVLLTIGMVGNTAVTLLGDAMPAHVAFGLLTAVSGIALVVHYVRAGSHPR